MKNAVFFPNKNKARGYDQLSILWLKNRQTQYTYPIYMVIKHSNKEFRNSTNKQITLSYIRKHLEFKLDQGMNNNLTYRHYKNFLHREWVHASTLKNVFVTYISQENAQKVSCTLLLGSSSLTKALRHNCNLHNNL